MKCSSRHKKVDFLNVLLKVLQCQDQPRNHRLNKLKMFRSISLMLLTKTKGDNTNWSISSIDEGFE